MDLSKARGHECPGVRCDGTYYLARLRSHRGPPRLVLGHFRRQWYGLNFNGGPGLGEAGVQFDAPGWNASSWLALWEVVQVVQDDSP